ncbi:hypothetical protein QE152_g10871 [Popillia japonica]|uniref:Uncharacterized protein n=1 Tax=Popillia japonica TaxID=7064 RepID=A0AAW1LPA4_POPJA
MSSFRCAAIMIHRTFLIGLLTNCAYSLQTICDDQTSATTNSENGYIKLCSDNGLSVYSVNDTFENSVCNEEACLRKCCPIDSEVVNKTCVSSVRNFTDDLIQLTQSKTTFYVVHGFLQCPTRTLLTAADDPENKYSILDNGQLEYSRVKMRITNYCVDNFGFPGMSALVCFPDEEVTYCTGMNYLHK